MWGKNKESVNQAKRITKLLQDVWCNKDFAIDILKALENHTDVAESFITFLEEESELVPSEIYEKVMDITEGTYVKEFSGVCVAKNHCIEKSSEENWQLLFNALNKADLIWVCEWDVTEEEKNALKNSNVGDIIHIESNIRPVILSDKSTQKAIIPVYTSEYEIDRKYRSAEYALETVDWSYTLSLFDSCLKVLGDAMIILDIDSDKCLKINQDIIEQYRKKS